jgi:hypothetical protein
VQDTLINNIFSVTDENFQQKAIENFQFQYQYNKVYQQWCNLLYRQSSSSSSLSLVKPVSGTFGPEIRNPASDTILTTLPYLPISFFKSHSVCTTLFEPQQVFESSGTTQTVNSRHLIKDITLYKESFIRAFELFYGNIKGWCIIGLLPSYLERNNSSLIMMVDELIKRSGKKAVIICMILTGCRIHYSGWKSGDRKHF